MIFHKKREEKSGEEVEGKGRRRDWKENSNFEREGHFHLLF